MKRFVVFLDSKVRKFLPNRALQTLTQNVSGVQVSSNRLKLFGNPKRSIASRIPRDATRTHIPGVDSNICVVISNMRRDVATLNSEQ